MKIRLFSPFVCFVSASFVAAAAACSSSGGGGLVVTTQDGAAQDGSGASSGGSSSGLSSSGGSSSGASSSGSADVGTDAPVDAPTDASEAGPAPTCGQPPNRYTILTGANAGLVRDNVTGLIWMSDSVGAGERPDAGGPQTEPDAAAYCMSRGMRVPTKDEAAALAANYASCAFGQWGTWTSTAFDSTHDWVVDYLGDISPQVTDNFPSAVLCVRSPAG